MLYVSNYSIKVSNNEPLTSRYSKIAITDTKDGVTEKVSYAQLCNVLEANPDLKIKGLSSFKLPGDLGLFISLYIIDPDDYSTYKADYDWDVSTQPFKDELTRFMKNITENIESNKDLTAMSLYFICPDIGYAIITRPDRIEAVAMIDTGLDALDWETDPYSTGVESSDSFRVVLREGCFDVQIYHDGVWETRLRYSRHSRDGYLATFYIKTYSGNSNIRREGLYPVTPCPEAGTSMNSLDIVVYNNKLLPIINDVSYVGKLTIIDTNMGRFIYGMHHISRSIIGNIDPPDYLVTPQDKDIWFYISTVSVKDKASFEVDNKGNTVLLLSDRPKVYWRLQEFNQDFYWISESRYERRVDDDDFAGVYDKLNDQFVSDYLPNVVGDEYLIKNNSNMFGQGISDIQYGIGVAELTSKYCSIRDIMREAFLGVVGAPVVIFEDVKLTKLPGTDLKCGFKKVPKQEGGIKFTVGDRDYYTNVIYSCRGDSLLGNKVKTGDFNYICRYKVGKSYELGVACAVGDSRIYVFPLSTLEHLVPLDYDEGDCEWRKFNDK